jgi:6-pyruvoyltetrahydropterin/6-carboxytetrahydropterin synthase
MANNSFTQALSNYVDSRINHYHHTKMGSNSTPQEMQSYADKVTQAEQALENRREYQQDKQPVQYRYTSTKEYHNAFPCAYRQWRADSHCNLIHGYAFSMKFYFGTDALDVRNWAADYGGLKELKGILEDQFDHTLLVAQDDPELETFKLLQAKNMAKLTILPRLGCEGLADMLYRYVNGVYIPDMWGTAEAERLWCYRVEVRETQSNMAYREGHREWAEDLFE